MTLRQVSGLLEEAGQMARMESGEAKPIEGAAAVKAMKAMFGDRVKKDAHAKIR
jgi:hypothetical protein